MVFLKSPFFLGLPIIPEEIKTMRLKDIHRKRINLLDDEEYTV